MSTNENRPSDAELLSALMDDELPATERSALLARIAAEPRLQARWERYHAARAALGTGAARLSPGFAGRVRQAREQEPAVLAPGRAAPGRPGWLRPVAGVAIAASVALVAFGGLTLLRGGSIGDRPVQVASGPAADGAGGDHDPAAVRPVAVATTEEAGAVPSRPVRKRLMLYLASHSEYAGVIEVPTGMSYGRLGSLNAGQ